MMTGARNQSLDALRGIAILLVLGRHFGYYSLWYKIGWAGVDLFFVLSGFLISGLLFREYIETGKIRFGRFIVRRAFKIWPPLYIFLLVISLFIARGAAQFPWADVLHSALFVRNYYMSRQGSYILGHTWSLCVEEHFYLLLPLLLVSMIRMQKSVRAVIPLFVVSAAACLWLRIALRPEDAYATHFRIDDLFAGVALGYLYHFRADWFRKLTGHSSLLVAAILVSPVARFEWRDRDLQTWGLTSILLGFALLLAWSVSRKPPMLLKPLAKVGVFSYSIYLWQQPVSMLFLKLGSSSAVVYWLYVCAAIATGVIMAKLIEFPALRLRDRLLSIQKREGSATASRRAHDRHREILHARVAQ